MPKLSRSRMDLRKLSNYSIIINSLQILAALTVLVLALVRGDKAFSGVIEQTTLVVLSSIVVSGAIVDIRDAQNARRVGAETDMIEAAYKQLSTLNGTLRAQRHDFMNHLQVVYSLMEMQDYGEAQAYIETVYQDIQRVSRTLKTSIPAVNALLASKLSECEERGVVATLRIGSAYTDMPVPDWELCRVFSNLIDNGLDAMKGSPVRELRIETSETLHDYGFVVSNTGPAIPDSVRERLFVEGFSTKGDGRGMGLAIVKGIVEAYDGRLTLHSDEKETRFTGSIPKATGAL